MLLDEASAHGSAASVGAPVVTFAIPCRNAGAFLRPQLASLLAQSRQDFELLLVDDGSSDGSAALAKSLVGARLDLRQNQVSLGIAGNWNRCLELVQTPFVCLAHQDDVYLPQYLERMLAALQARPDAGMAHCRAITIDGDGRSFVGPAERYKQHFWKGEPGPDRAAHYARLWRGNFVCCPSVLFRTTAVRAVGAFRTDLRFALDWEYWFRLLRAGHGIVDVKDELVQYRRHAAAASQTATADRSRFEEELTVLAEVRAAGIAAGLLPPDVAPSAALRNNLLHEAFADLQAGRHAAVAGKLAFLRERAPELWGDPYVRVFRALWRCGPPGRWSLALGRRLAVGLGLGGAA